MKVRWSAGTLVLDLAGARVAGAATTAWAINASSGNPHIQANDIDPGVASGDFGVPNDDARRSNTRLSVAVPYSVAAKSLVPSVVEAVVQLPAPLLPVSAGIGGAAADLLYVGAVTPPAAGLFQVNVRVPANGPTVGAPLVLRFGKATSLPGVTLAKQ